MYFNIHVLAIVTTIIFYFLLKSFKTNNQKNNDSKQSNLIYLLFAPTIVYLTVFLKEKYIQNNINNSFSFTQQEQTIPNIIQIPISRQITSPVSSIYPIQSTLSDMS